MGLVQGADLRGRRNRHSYARWRPFLDDLAQRASNYIVIAIDEVDVIKFDGSDLFYCVIKNDRDMKRGVPE